MKNWGQSTCKDCGTTLYWGDKPQGGRHRPLERYVGRELLCVLDKDGVVQRLKDLYIPHDCKWPRWES